MGRHRKRGLFRRRDRTRRCRQRRGRKRLFWKLYGFGFLLLVLVIVAVGLSAKLVNNERSMRETPERLQELVTDTAPEKRADRLVELHELLQIDVALYDVEGELLATSGDMVPPLHAVDVPSGDHPEHGQDGWNALIAVHIAPPEGDEKTGPQTLIIAYDIRAGLLQFILGLLATLATCALVLLPLARSIARPLERITDAAEALGRGELDARTGIRRRDEIGVLAEAFDQMAARIDSMVQNEKEMLANVSHELRTPLARIRVALELCEESKDVEAMRRRLVGIAQDIDELDKLIEDVLLTARLDLALQRGEPTIPLRLGEVEVDELLQRAKRRAGELHTQRQITFDDASELSEIKADEGLILRVVNNLIDNAVKYGVPADAELDAPIEVHAALEDDQVVLEVSDRGPGIPPADLERIFEPFFRGDRSRGLTPGFGLGLPLCKRIVEAHGGAIALTAREGGGTVARVQLPA